MAKQEGSRQMREITIGKGARAALSRGDSKLEAQEAVWLH
jgi:hypothetical protein